MVEAQGAARDGRGRICQSPLRLSPIAQLPPPWHTQAMPRKATITETTLKSLGPKRLAALVLDGCQRDDVLEKKVRMMLAAKGGGDALDAELTTRIKSLRTGRSFVDWREAGNLAETIDTIRASITGELAAKNPKGGRGPALAAD